MSEERDLSLVSVNHQAIWSGFYKKPLCERQTQLKLVFPQVFTPSPTSSSAASSVYVTPDTTSCNSPISDFSPETNDQNTFSPILNNNNKINYLINKLESLSTDDNKKPFPINGLDENIADNMIENCVGYVIFITFSSEQFKFCKWIN
jgi:hydroxymethylglutaryl-CoA reductase